jgi:endonuclease/exonuclease/phosphatase family metal-dependent hydrolase
MFSLSTGTCEIIAASLSKIKVIVIAIYRPGSAAHANFSLILQKLRHYLEQVKDEQEI